MTNRSNETVLLITDCDFAVSGVDAVGWTEEIPNVADYDNLIIDLVSLSQRLHRGEVFEEVILRPTFGEIQQLIMSSGKVICVTPPENPLGPGPVQINPFWWSPIPLVNVLEEGKSRRVLDYKYERYFETGVRIWRSRLDLTERFEEVDPDSVIEFDITPLVETRYAAPLAGAAYMTLQKASGRGFARGWHPAGKSGPVIVVPATDQVPHCEGIQMLLEDLLGLALETPPPRWIPGFQFPGEREIETEIEALSQKRLRMAEEIAGKKENLDSLAKFKRLLYESGTALEHAVWDTLGRLGAKVQPSEVLGKEDRWFHYAPLAQDAAMEVKGHTGSMTTRDARQADDWVSDILERMDKPMKGVLFGNPNRNERPDQRPDPWPDDVVRYAKTKGLALVTTTQLFDILILSERGETDPEEFFKALFETDGIVLL